MLRIESHFLRKRHFYWCRIISAQFCFFLILSGSCIDRISIKIPDSYSSQLVVDGLITDEPGPYTVNLSLASPINGFLEFRKKATAKSVMIFDNAGNSELLKELEAGTYQTKEGGIQGVVGREYSIRIEMHDGKIYESIPDRMNPTGRVDSIYYTLESFKPIDEPTQYGFAVYVNADGISGAENFNRFRYEGIFEVDADPWLFHSIERIPGGDPDARACLQKPRDCAGFNGEPCTCCKCWVRQSEERPTVFTDQFVANGKFNSIRVGYVPIDYWSFRIKYRIEVKLMSLSQTAFNYWKVIQSQKEAGTSLFQPPYGKLITNVFEKSGSATANGIFYASSVKKKQKYLSYNEVKDLDLQPASFSCYADKKILTESCLRAFKNSSNKRPLDWR